MARCEELLKEYALDGKVDLDEMKTLSIQGSQTPPKGEEPIADWNRNGKLIHEDGSVRFVDSYMLSTVYDELRAMREIIDSDDNTPEDENSDSMTPDTNADLLFGADTPQPITNNAELQPSPGHIFRLWQVFLDRVNPLIKLVHVPTLQPYLVEATSGAPLPKNIEALLFSIYTLAAIALSDAECHTILGYSREAALHRFSTGVRLTLTRIGFLKTHDLATLQALVHYIISLHGRYNRHAAWVLNGVVIRIAQKMGLHRDGTALGLSPFETEMRRRLWFQIIGIDVKTALMSGLGHSLLPRAWDTEEPKNVNDVDLHPSATDPVKDREGATEMIFVLLTNKVSNFLVDSPGLEPVYLYNDSNVENLPGAPSKEMILKFRSMFEELAKSLLELFDKNCDAAAGPLHEFTLEFKAVIMQRAKELLQPSDKTLHTHKDHMFRMAVEQFGDCLANYRNSSRAVFLWYMRLQFHFELFAFVVGQLCQRPSGPLVDRAWDTVEHLLEYHPELLKINASKENMLLASLLVKGWNFREEHCLQQRGITLTVPPYIEYLRSIVPQDYVKTENNSPWPPSETPKTDHMDTEETYGSQIPVPGSMDPTFDEYIGNYLDGTGWDVFPRADLTSNSVPVLQVAGMSLTGSIPQAGATVGGGLPAAPLEQQDPNQPPNHFSMFGMGQPPPW